MNFVSCNLEMDKDDLASCLSIGLIGVHACNLRQHIAHHEADVDIFFRADGTAVVNLRLWAEREPPFRHAVVVAELGFAAGYVTEIETVKRVAFGA
jgi:hypothetical protein